MCGRLRDWESAGGLAPARCGQQFRHDSFLKHLLDQGGRFIESMVHGTQAAAMTGNAERTFWIAMDGINGVDDVQDGELLGTLLQREAAIESASRYDQPRATQALHHFRQVAGGRLGDLSYKSGGARYAVLIGQADNRSEGVFRSLRDHGTPGVVDICTYTSCIIHCTLAGVKNRARQGVPPVNAALDASASEVACDRQGLTCLPNAIK